MATLDAAPQIILGTMAFGGTADEDECVEIVRIALAAGIEWFDTANAYEDGRGEHIVGRLTAGTPAKIATKVGLQPGRLRSGVIAESVRGSLERLGRTRVDRLVIHAPDRETPLAESMQAMAVLAADGAIGELGVSNASTADLVESLEVADAVGAPRPSSAQQAFNLLARAIDEDFVAAADAAGVAIHAFSPLAGGLLARRPGPEPAPGRFTSEKLGSLYTSRYWTEPLRAAASALADLADEAAMSLAELSTRWVVGCPGISAVLIGPSRSGHLTRAIDAISRGPLDRALLARCDEIAQAVR